MANPAFAAGFTENFGNVLLGKLKQDHDDELKQKETTLQALTLLMNSGRVSDPNHPNRPLLESLLTPTGKKGKGKGKGQDSQDPLARFTLFKTMVGGKGGAPSPQGTAGGPGTAPATTTPPTAPGTPQGTPSLPVTPFGQGAGPAPAPPAPAPAPAPQSGFFKTDAQLATEAAEADRAKAEAQAEGKDAALIKDLPAVRTAIKDWVASGTSPSVAYGYFGLKAPATVREAKEPRELGDGTFVRDVFDDTVSATVPAYSYPVAPPAGARGSAAGLFSGPDEQALETQNMLEGKDKFGNEIKDPALRARVIAAGKEAQKNAATKQAIQVYTADAKRDAVEGPPPSEMQDWVGTEAPPDPDPAVSAKVDKTTGVDQVTIYQSAIALAVANQTLNLGLGSQGQVRATKLAVARKAAHLVEAAGTTMPELRAEYQSLASADRQRLNQYTANSAASASASGQLDLLGDAAGKLPRTNAKIVNALVQAAQGNFTAAKDLSQTELYVYTAARDYAKVSSGSAASVAGLTDAATAAANRILSASQSPAAMNAVIDGMQREMNVQITRQWEEIQNINTAVGKLGTSKIGQFLGAVSPPTSGGLNPPPPAGGPGRGTGAGTGGGPGTGGGAAPPKFTVAQVVTIRGKQMTITKVYPDGTFDAVPVIKK